MAKDKPKSVQTEQQRATETGEKALDAVDEVVADETFMEDLDAVETVTDAKQAEGGVVEPQQTQDKDLKTQLDDAQLQLEQAKEQTLRAMADTQNARRRAERDVENAHKYALEKFCNALLPVVDNLERAQQSAGTSDDEAVKNLLQGVELTHKSFIDVLSKFNLEQVDPLGEPFDPQFHQAITMTENPDAEPNTVLDVMQKGYTLNGRLIRPAMVVVSTAASPNIDETA